MKLTKANAARQLGISRTTLYKLIEQGTISATPDGFIDSTELVRAAPVVDTLKERSQTPMNVMPISKALTDDEHNTPLTDSVHERPLTDVYERQQTSTISPIVDILREQVQLLREELREVREETRKREALASEREALLLQMLQEAHQRYDRLLTAGPSPDLKSGVLGGSIPDSGSVVLPNLAPDSFISPDGGPSLPPHLLQAADLAHPELLDPVRGTVAVDETTHMSAYSPDTHYLGALCKRGHNWQGTEKSLRKKNNGRCLACDAEHARARRRRR